MAGRKLLITSDDMGMTWGINCGIERAMTQGVVGATNLMVPCPWLGDAVRRVQQNRLPAGIHLTLTCEWDLYRWRPLTDARTLRAVDGGMHHEFAELPRNVSDEEIFAECAAQLSELRRRGVEPTHVDTHMLASTSTRPIDLRLKRLVERFAAAEGLRYTYQSAIDGSLRYFASELHFSGMAEDELRGRLLEAGPGVHHVICHCAEPTPELENMCGAQHPARKWTREYRVGDLSTMTGQTSLEGTSFKRWLERQGFELITVAELPQA